MDNINIRKIYEDALNDPDLMETLDIDSILNTLESDQNDYLENLTFEKIQKDIYDALVDVRVPKPQIPVSKNLISATLPPLASSPGLSRRIHLTNFPLCK